MWVLKQVFRLIMPWIVARFVKKMQKRAEEQFGGPFGNGFGGGFGAQEQQYQQSTEDPEVTIIRTNRKEERETSLSDELGGEYTNYEEVK